MAIALDNASNNNTFLKELGSICEKKNINFNHEKNRVRCLAHIINLAVQENLKHVKTGEAEEENVILSELSEKSKNNNMGVISKLRKLIVKIRSLPQKREKFSRHCTDCNINNDDQKSLNLILDVRTRWNSTFLMLNRALKLREVSKF